MANNENIVSEYLKITNEYKEKYGPNTILLMQVGAFYEIYDLKSDDEDEVFSNMKDICSLCQLNYSEKKNVLNGKQVLMAGFRDYTLDKYLQKILNHNYTIVVFNQEKAGKGFKRVLDQVYSPGTFLQIDNNENISNNIMTIWMEDLPMRTGRKIIYGISVINIITGKSYIYEYECNYLFDPTSFDDLERVLSVFKPSEMIFISNFDNKKIDAILQYIGTQKVLIHRPDIQSDKCKNCMKQTYIHHILQTFFGNHSQYNCFEFDTYTFATQSLCYLLDFIQEHNSSIVHDISFPLFNNVSNKMVLANHTLKQLNIIECENSHGPFSSVSRFVNKCCSNMGKRLFHYELTNPVFDETWLQNEYNSVELLMNYIEKVQNMRTLMKDCYDIEKIIRQVYINKTYPNHLYQLFQSIHVCQSTNKILFQYFPQLFTNYENNYENLHRKIDGIYSFLNENLIIENCKRVNSLLTFDINIIQKGVSHDLDNAYEQLNHNEELFIAIQRFFNDFMIKEAHEKTDTIKTHETEKSGKSLQMTTIRSNKMKKIISEKREKTIEIMGHKFSLDDITFEKASSNSVELKFPLLLQTLHKTIALQNTINNLISKIYGEIIERIKTDFIESIRDICDFICRIDVLSNKAYIACKYGYVKPEIQCNETSFVDVEGLRHCLIEHLQNDEIYVTNDTHLGIKDQNGMLLYGTNAVGKTSFIRSIGIAVILAQCGMFVPCSRFCYKPYKSIYSRILGNDNLFKGMSTFAVEISELRVILKMADENSLILGDELCSGTETESALSIFVASLQKISASKSSFIFATHFHEIVNYQEINDLTNLHLYHMHVVFDKEQGRLLYDRKLKPGSGVSNYGLEVCKSLYLEDAFVESAYAIRNKYFPSKQGELSKKSTAYNTKKIRSVCEICSTELSSEVHHINPQKIANEFGYIGSHHKNHVANLMAVCESCHLNIHSENLDLTKKKTVKY